MLGGWIWMAGGDLFGGGALQSGDGGAEARENKAQRTAALVASGTIFLDQVSAAMPKLSEAEARQ